MSSVASPTLASHPPQNRDASAGEKINSQNNRLAVFPLVLTLGTVPAKTGTKRQNRNTRYHFLLSKI